MARPPTHRLLPLPAIWLGATLVARCSPGCSQGAVRTPEPRAAEVAIAAQSSPKQRPPETKEQEKSAEPAPAGDLCPTICTRTTTLACGPLDNCLRACAELRSADKCGEELESFLRCSATHPVEHWECDPDTGAAAIKNGFCDTEQGAVVACLQTAS